MASPSDIQQALLRARDAFAHRPSSALKEDAAALAVWSDGLATTLVHPAVPGLRTDMPQALGGEGEAPTPGWFFRAGIAACLATSIAMQAAQRGIALTRLAVEAHSESDARGMLGDPQVTAGPLRYWIDVVIESPGAPDDVLHELVRTADAHSPMPSAVRRAMDVAIEVRLGSPQAA